MRRSRDELAKDIERMLELRAENKTYRQIAQIMGYKSPGTISDLLRRRGHFGVVLNQIEINFLIDLLEQGMGDTTGDGILAKLKKNEEK